MLPVPVDYPQLAIRQYDSYNPPITGIQFNRECAQFGNAIIAKVANMASEMANKNAARMFCYNLLSSNNWNNPEFANICAFAGDLVVLFYYRQQSLIMEQYLDTAVDNALGLTTSRYVCQYPELQNLCGQEVCRSSLDNVELLKQTIAAIQQLRSQPQQQMSPMTSPMQQQNTGIPSYYSQQISIPRLGNNNTGPSLVELQTDRFASRIEQKASVQEIRQQEFQRPIEIRPITLVSEPTMQESGIAVEFSNQTYPASNVVKSEIKIESPKEEVQISSGISEIVNEEQVLEIDQSAEQDPDVNLPKPIDPCLKEMTIVEDTLDSMILTSKALYVKNIGDSGLDLFYRVFGYYVSSYFSNENYYENTKYWKSLGNFSKLAKRFLAEIQGMKNHSLKNDSEVEIDRVKFCVPKNAQQYFGLISMTENIFTKAINNFVKHELGFNIRIDSFIVDINDLKDYLKDKNENKYYKFLDWEKYFLDTYAFEIDKNVTPFDVPENVHIFGTPVFASVTCVKYPNLKAFIDVTLPMGETLEMYCKDEDPIWEVHKNINEHKKDFNSWYSEDYYVMANNERIRVFTSEWDERKLTLVRI